MYDKSLQILVQDHSGEFLFIDEFNLSSGE